MIWTATPSASSGMLIGFDLLLVVVLGLLLYATSARDAQAPPGRFDVLQLLLVTSALIVDALALWRSPPASRIRIQSQQDSRSRPELDLARKPNLAAVLYARFLVRRARSRASSAGRRPTCRRIWFGRIRDGLLPVIFHYR